MTNLVRYDQFTHFGTRTDKSIGIGHYLCNIGLVCTYFAKYLSAMQLWVSIKWQGTVRRTNAELLWQYLRKTSDLHSKCFFTFLLRYVTHFLCIKSLIWVKCWIVLFALHKGCVRMRFVVWFTEEISETLCLLYEIYHRVDHILKEYLNHYVAARNTRTSAALGELALEIPRCKTDQFSRSFLPAALLRALWTCAYWGLSVIFFIIIKITWHIELGKAIHLYTRTAWDHDTKQAIA